ncbi:16964_t:CDS:2, partial [Gigaspora rosea]
SHCREIMGVSDNGANKCFINRFLDILASKTISPESQISILL